MNGCTECKREDKSYNGNRIVMKNTYRIVTKSRYSVLRICLLFVLFTIEYWLLVDKSTNAELMRFVAGYIGFIALQTIFVFRSNSKKVFLRYEFALSLIVKCVVIDVIYTFLLAATDVYNDFALLLMDMVVMLLCNIFTIIAVLMFINVVAKLRNPKPEKVLYVRADDEIAETRLEGYDAVYLYDIPAQQRNDWLKLCYEKDMTVYTTAKLSDVLIRTSGIAQDRDMPVFYCTKFGLGGPTALLKRCMDIICCLIALLVLWPIILITAFAIRIEDGGPIFYTQVRCTKDLKKFTIYKFRSMYVDCEEKTGARLSCEDDERVTKVGRVIRKWKIDELPQIFNILKGDMSIVGPRPERPELIEENCKLVPEFVLRSKVKAGLTGYAQVRGNYETDKLEKLKWDLIYIENYSLLLDLKIIIITAIMLIKQKL